MCCSRSDGSQIIGCRVEPVLETKRLFWGRHTDNWRSQTLVREVVVPACREGRERTGIAGRLGPLPAPGLWACSPPPAAWSAPCLASTPTPPAGLALPQPAGSLPCWAPLSPQTPLCRPLLPQFFHSSRFTQYLLSLFCFCSVSQPQHDFLQSQGPVSCTYARHSKDINKYASNKRAVMTQ